MKASESESNSKASRNSHAGKAHHSSHVMAPNPLSSATLVALALAGLLILLLVAFLFLFLRLKFPPISPLSRSIRSIDALEPQTGAMEPVFAPTSSKVEGPDGPNLLDLSSPEEFRFPTLQPQL